MTYTWRVTALLEEERRSSQARVALTTPLQLVVPFQMSSSISSASSPPPSVSSLVSDCVFSSFSPPFSPKLHSLSSSISCRLAILQLIHVWPHHDSFQFFKYRNVIFINLIPPSVLRKDTYHCNLIGTTRYIAAICR